MQSGGRRRAKAHGRCTARAMSGRVMVADDNHEVERLGSDVGDAVAPAMDLWWLTSLMGQLTGRISHNSWAADVG